MPIEYGGDPIARMSAESQAIDNRLDVAECIAAAMMLAKALDRIADTLPLSDAAQGLVEEAANHADEAASALRMAAYEMGTWECDLNNTLYCILDRRAKEKQP
jgi:hypothetical protein